MHQSYDNQNSERNFIKTVWQYMKQYIMKKLNLFQECNRIPILGKVLT